MGQWAQYKGPCQYPPIGLHPSIDFKMSFVIEKDQYTVTTTTECNVVAQDDKVTSQIWLRTPALDQDLIDKVVQIQLQTKSHDQGPLASAEALASWSWFDIIVLESPEATQARVKDGLALIWFSHENKLCQGTTTEKSGPLLNNQNIFDSLKVGNALAVRVCAQFPGWENHASEGRLILRTSEKGRKAQPPPDESQAEYLGLVTGQISKLSTSFDKYLNAATPEDAPPAYSLVREMLPTGPLRADQVSVAEASPLRVMSLDGGGVRGISALYILQAILAKMTNNPNAKPCDVFDMIAGTSTGGLIAIMLGRLKMTIPECIEVYKKLASQIFSANLVEKGLNFAKTGAYYTKDNFEKGLKNVIKQKTGDENATMLDPDSNNCKVFVVSGQSQDLNHTSAEQFRTYTVDFPSKFAGCAIWQAARATCAAPTYLPSITIDGTEFVDGGIRFNNPSLLLLGEINAVFGIARHVACFLTIGTGMQPNIKLDEQPTNPFEVPGYLKALMQATIKVATDCETTHHLSQGFFTGRNGVYWRFNAGVKAGNDWAPMISLDDYQGIPRLETITKTYLQAQVTAVAQCASTLD